MKPSKKQTILIIVTGLLVVISLNFFQKEVKGFFYLISSPIQKTLQQTSNNVSDFFGGVFSVPELKKENKSFQLRIQELLAQKTSLQQYKEENQFLRNIMEIGLEKEFRLTLAEVINRDISQDSFLINQGSKDGLSEGMPVITQERVLLGKITQIYEDFSRVSLISSQGSSFDVEIKDREAAGVVKGKGGSLVGLDFVSQDKEIKEGDLVTSASLGGIYPKGLLVGLVQEVERSDINPFYKIKVSLFFDIDELGNVLVILDF